MTSEGEGRGEREKKREEKSNCTPRVREIEMPIA